MVSSGTRSSTNTVCVHVVGVWLLVLMAFSGGSAGDGDGDGIDKASKTVYVMTRNVGRGSAFAVRSMGFTITAILGTDAFPSPNSSMSRGFIVDLVVDVSTNSATTSTAATLAVSK